MTVYYADADNGNDSNDGLTYETAKQTLQAVFDLYSATTTYKIVLHIYGHFTEGVYSLPSAYTADNFCAIIGHDGAEIDVSAYPLFSSQPTNMLFKDITFNNLYAGLLYIGGNLAFHSCIFNHNGYYRDSRFDRINANCIDYGPFSFSGAASMLVLFSRCNIIGSGTQTNLYYDADSSILTYCKLSDTTNSYVGGVYAGPILSHTSIHNSRYYIPQLQGSGGGKLYNTVMSHDDPSFYTAYFVSNFAVAAVDFYYMNNVWYGWTYRGEDNIFLDETLQLTTKSYADPANGDWTLSEEMKAIVGRDGRTPGAVQAKSASGGSYGFC